MLLKLIFSLILVLHVQIEVSDSLYGQIESDLDSYELIDAYDVNGTQNGHILFHFKDANYDYDIDRSGVLDIADLIFQINYMFPRTD